MSEEKKYIEEKIWCLGKEVKFRVETDDMDDAQALLDLYRNRGKVACALHKRDKHQIYSE